MKQGAGQVFIPAKSDVIFKALFGDELNKDFLIGFLQAVLKLDIDEYADIQIIDPHLKRRRKGDKLGILDVKVRTKAGKTVNIEIQLQITSEMRERIVYYGTKLITEQLQSGDEYDLIKKTISIVIAGEIFLREHNEYHDVFTLYSRITKTEFTDILEIHTLELPKLPLEADGSELWTWLELINAESEEELKMLVKKEPKMRAVVERLLEINRDPATRALHEAREKDRRDSNARVRLAMQRGKSEGRAEGITEGIQKGKAEGITEGMQKGKAEGITEGMQKGKMEGKMEAARNLKALGIPTDIIVKSIGLPPEEIAKL